MPLHNFCHPAWHLFDILVVDSGLQDLVELLVERLEYSGPLDLTQYFIKKKVFLDKMNNKGVKILYVDFYLGRRI